MFNIGDFFPNNKHLERINRYKRNEQLFKGNHYEVFEKYKNVLSPSAYHNSYISSNLPGIIVKKSADFLFGQPISVFAGKGDGSEEQKALERIKRENDLDILNYESTLSNGYRGDSFYKLRWGQEHEGLVPNEPFRVIIENQNPEYVYPETYKHNDKKIMCYHVCIPEKIKGDEYVLNVESHYPNKIVYHKHRMTVVVNYSNGLPKQWRIYSPLDEPIVVETGIAYPLVVHVPNYTTDSSWMGIDDLTEHISQFEELNNRMSYISDILNKHSDPLMVVPSGTLVEDVDGSPTFRAGVDKVFEIMDKSEVTPQYITWQGKLSEGFEQIKMLTEQILTNAEIPAVALGSSESGGTSGSSSGLNIKWRINSLLSKIARKRSYYDKSLQRVFLIAQLIEHNRLGSKINYEITIPTIKFKDGFPEDKMETTSLLLQQTGGAKLTSQLKAIMELHGCTEEVARNILKQITDEQKEEQETVQPSFFNSLNEVDEVEQETASDQ